MNYSLQTLVTAYLDNKVQINSYLSGKSIEHNGDGLILGMSTGVFLTALLIFVALWIWGIFTLINEWYNIPMWARIVGGFFLIPGVPLGPIVTLIVVYATRGSVYSDYPAREDYMGYSF